MWSDVKQLTGNASNNGNKRNHYYDGIRAIGILLVISGHTLGISKSFDLYIYSFHMPLFFFLSGLMLNLTRLRWGLLATLQHYSFRLLVPYFLFSLITWVPWVLFTRHLGADVALNIPAWKPLIGTFYGVGIDGWLQHNAMLWFFPCLFLVHILFHQLWCYFRGRWLFSLVLACAALGYLLSSKLPFRAPWGAEATLLAMPFYALGYYISGEQPKLGQHKFRIAFCILALALLQYVLISTNGRVDMNFLSLNNPFLFYFGAFAGIGVLTGAVYFLPKHPLIERVADGSMLAFCMHRTLFSLFTGVGLLLTADMQAFKSSATGSIVYTLGSVGVSIILLPLVRRFLPVLLGGR